MNLYLFLCRVLCLWPGATRTLCMYKARNCFSVCQYLTTVSNHLSVLFVLLFIVHYLVINFPLYSSMHFSYYKSKGSFISLVYKVCCWVGNVFLPLLQTRGGMFAQFQQLIFSIHCSFIITFPLHFCLCVWTPSHFLQFYFFSLVSLSVLFLDHWLSFLYQYVCV